VRDLRKVPIEELYVLHFSPDVVRVVKSRKIRWAWHYYALENHSKKCWFETLEHRRPFSAH
jgi:hypothetical protein